MRVGIRLCARVALLGLLIPLAQVGRADPGPEDEYRKLIKVTQDVQPLGATPFGESISLYDGSLTFDQTDVEEKGIGPDLIIARHFKFAGQDELQLYNQNAFGEWDINIPRITTQAPVQFNGIDGWMVDSTTNKKAICTQFNKPPPLPGYLGGKVNPDSWTPDQWWHGYQMVIPGAGSQEVMMRFTGDTRVPSISGFTSTAVTRNHWAVGCQSGLVAQNDSTREGFVAYSPNGTKYTFNHLAYRPDATMRRDTGDQRIEYVQRTIAAMDVTQIADRFGNTLTYTYDSQDRLTDIKGGDGRWAQLSYVGTTTKVNTITLQPGSSHQRVWTYNYKTYSLGAAPMPGLQSITLPDGKQWVFNFDALALSYTFTDGQNTTCSGTLTEPVDSFSGSITHPSGLTGTFTLGIRKRGRSNTPKSCQTYLPNITPDQGGYALIPSSWYIQVMLSKKFSGPGMTDQLWTYSYSPPNDSWSTSCTTPACPTTVYTDEAAPDGHVTRSTFSNKWGITESQLISTQTYAGAPGSSVLLQSASYTYGDSSGTPYAPRFGYSLQSYVNQDQVNYFTPQTSQVVTQDGADVYTNIVENFDVFAHPVKVIKKGPTGSQVEDTTTYLNNQSLWVIDTPTSQGRSGLVTSAFTYDPGTALPSAHYVFGTRVMRYSYLSNGLLNTFEDENNNTTSLSAYTRGIPTSIAYPDATFMSVGVDEFGQITSIRNPRGNTTSYQYDAMGRLSQVTYPTNATEAWAPQVIKFDVYPAARGINGPHWERWVTQGTRKSVTYYDAEFRPILADVSSTSGAPLVTSANSYDYRGSKTFTSFPMDGAQTITSLTAATNGTATTYDGLGRPTHTQVPISATQFATTTTNYLSGARVQSIDALGHSTVTAFQVFDAPSQDSPTQVVAPEGVTQTIVRDDFGNPKSIAQSGTGVTPLEKDFVYDSMMRLCRTYEPESKNTVMSLDLAGNLLWSATGQTVSATDCGIAGVVEGVKTKRTYNAVNQVTQIVYPGGTPAVTNQYLNGKLQQAQSGTSTWTYTYNLLDMLSGETLSLDGYNWGFGYGFDAAGAMSVVQYPDQQFVHFAPDALGRPTQAESYVGSAAYYPDGVLSSLRFGNGTVLTQQQNARHLPGYFKYALAGSPLVEEVLAYDLNANLLTVTDNAGGQRTKTFTYDGLNRLTSANGLWGMETYTYDALNNITSKVSPDLSQAFQYDGTNRLSQVRDGSGNVRASYTYDDHGNLRMRTSSLAGASMTLNFDGAERLASVDGRDSYIYDASGRRVKKVTNGDATTYYVYSNDGKLMWQYDPLTAFATRYVYLGGKLVAEASVDTSAFSQSQINVTLALAGPPTLSADGLTVSVPIDIANNGTVTLTSTSRDPVHLAARAFNAAGTLLSEVAPRANIPNVAPGTHAVATFVGPASQMINNGSIVKLILLQEGVAWFDAWGVQPVAVGPFSSCATTSVYLCNTAYPLQPNEATSTLTVLAAPTLSSDGQMMVATIDVANRSYISFSSTGTYPINLGNHLGDTSGNTQVWDIGRASLPVIPPGGHASLSIGAPTAGATGNGQTVQFELVQEGQNWFRSFGFPAISVGPYGTLIVPASSTSPSYPVQWTAVPGASSYTLQEQVNGGAWSTVQSANILSWTASGRMPATYGYRMTPCASSCGAYSAVKSVSVISAPPAPAAISVPATSSGNIAIGWSTAQYATSYSLEASLNGGAFAAIYGGAPNSYAYTAPGSGTYTYRVRASNAVGYSGYSPSGSSVITFPPTQAPNIAVPASSNNGCYTVNWGGFAGMTSYVMQEQVNSGAWTTIANNGSGTLPICGKVNGAYHYRVQGCNAGGCGPWSAAATVTVALIPAVPIGLSLVQTAPLYKGRYTLSWNAASLATTYEVQMKTTTTGWNTVYQGSATNAAGILISTTGTVQFEVHACNPAGCSAWSAPVSGQWQST
jgi:YD repeat-containing protein